MTYYIGEMTPEYYKDFGCVIDDNSVKTYGTDYYWASVILYWKGKRGGFGVGFQQIEIQGTLRVYPEKEGMRGYVEFTATNMNKGADNMTTKSFWKKNSEVALYLN